MRVQFYGFNIRLIIPRFGAVGDLSWLRDSDVPELALVTEKGMNLI